MNRCRWYESMKTRGQKFCLRTYVCTIYKIMTKWCTKNTACGQALMQCDIMVQYTLFISHKNPPPCRCPPQPLSATAVCDICHRRAQNVAQDLHHPPPPLEPVSVTVVIVSVAICHKTHSAIHLPVPLAVRPSNGALKICNGCISGQGKLCQGTAADLRSPCPPPLFAAICHRRA